MSRRLKSGSQRMPARHDIPTKGKASSKVTRSASLYTTTTVSSRAKQHNSLLSTPRDSKSNSTQITSKPKIERTGPSERDAFYTNLLLLGFNPDEITAKNRGTSIPFDKDMFAVPNMIGFQAVMHFLFNKLDSVKFHEEFRDCWPICDRKQEQAFRKACVNWLTDISEREDSHLPRLVPSLFLSPGGARLYQLLMHFSTYILTKLIDSKKSLKVQYPLLTGKNNGLSDLMARSMKELISRERSDFFSTIQQSVIVNKECEQFANDLVNEYRSLNDEIREKRDILEKLREKGNILSPRGLDSISRRREENMSKIRENWKQIAKFYNYSRKERDIVTSIIKGTIDKHRILASEFDVRVPDVLLRSRYEDIEKRGIGNTVEAGKLNLISVLKLWTLSMEICQDQSRLKSLPKLDYFSPKLVGHVHDVTSYLANLRSLKNKIQDVDLPDVKRSIKELKKNTAIETPKRSQLGLVPATPPVSFEPSPSDDNILSNRPGRTPTLMVNTPEAAARIMNSVKERASKQEKSSKLPTRKDEGEQLEALPPWLRQHSARSGIDTGRISTPTRPRVVKQSSQKSQPTESSSTKMPTFKPALKSMDYSEKHTKPVIKSSKNSGLTKPKIPASKVTVKKIVSKELFTEKSSKERAEDDLIDQIVDVVMAESPEGVDISAESTPGYDTNDINLADPVRALDETPFLKRDKIRNSLDSSPALKSVKFSPNARVELEAENQADSFETAVVRLKSPVEVIRNTTPVNPCPRAYLSPLPEFDAPIDLPSFSLTENLSVSVHEPSPARLKSMRETPKPQITQLEAISPVDDLIDASLELVDLSSESDESEADPVITSDLLGLMPREPTPSCITPFKGFDVPSSPEKRAEVLNSDEKIDLVHLVEKSMEEEMLNLSLKAMKENSRQDNKSPFDIAEDNHTIRLTSAEGSPYSDSSKRQNSQISPRNDIKEVSSEQSYGSGDFQTISKENINYSDKKTAQNEASDIVSRFKLLKLRTQSGTQSPTVLTPDDDEVLDEVYLKESPRTIPDGKFTLDLDFDKFDVDDENNNSGLGDYEWDDEVAFRSPEKVVGPLKKPSVYNDFGGGDVLDFGMDVEDILVPASPDGGADSLP